MSTARCPTNSDRVLVESRDPAHMEHKDPAHTCWRAEATPIHSTQRPRPYNLLERRGHTHTMGNRGHAHPDSIVNPGHAHTDLMQHVGHHRC